MDRDKLKQQINFYKKKLVFLNQINDLKICSTMCPDNVTTFRVTKSEIRLSVNRLIGHLNTYYPNNQESKYAKSSIIMLISGAESTLENVKNIVKRDCLSCQFRKAAVNSNKTIPIRKVGLIPSL
jgi:type II secretory pathway component GspD/PulD (secretin)